MEQINTPRFFLGANTKSGFSSLYDSFLSPDGRDFLWVVKGGPGCGKSSLMKRIGAAAERAGRRAEYILCSGDPDSLDAVCLPEAHTAYVDGTAPHVIEAAYPGASSLYLDMSCFLDAGALRAFLSQITDLNRRYKALYGAAYALLAAAAPLLPKNQPGLLTDEATDALTRRVRGIAARELPPLKKPAAVTHRFLSANTCRGRVTLTDTLAHYCDRLYLLDNALGLGHLALQQLFELAAARGYDVILCHDPLEPEKLEALLLPECALVFLAVEDAQTVPSLPCRRLRLDQLLVSSLSAADRAALRQWKKESRAMLAAATETLAQAKALHDALEDVYHPYVDFAGADALAEEHIRRLNL